MWLAIFAAIVSPLFKKPFNYDPSPRQLRQRPGSWFGFPCFDPPDMGGPAPQPGKPGEFAPAQSGLLSGGLEFSAREIQSPSFLIESID
jgi:hypothetical protein